MNDGKRAGIALPKRLQELDAIHRLTPREKEVLFWVAQGFNNAEISMVTNIAEGTVKNHVGNLLRKLELHNRTQAAPVAWRTGLARNTES